MVIVMGLRLLFSTIIIITSIVVASCGGGSGGTTQTPTSVSTVTVLGSGIKGILANARVSIYELNVLFPLFYDPANPIAEGTTDSIGSFAALEIPMDTSNPLVLVVDGADGMDLNSGQTPVITSLVRTFTIQDALADSPIFATPYTTIAYEVAKFSSTSRTSNVDFQNNFLSAVADVGNALGFGVSTSVDFLATPAILSDSTVDQAQQAAVIQHRAAIEALAAVIVELKAASGNTLSAEDILVMLASDLSNDGVIDGDSGLNISAIPSNIENLNVPGTQIRVRDIGVILDADREYTGVNANSVSLFSPTLTAPTLLSGRNIGPTDDDNTGSLSDNVGSSGGNGGFIGTNTATPEPVGSLSTRNINFGNISVGSVSNTVALTLANIGNAPLTISNITISGQFSQTNNCNGYIVNGDSCIISLIFTPVSSGNKSGNVIINGDAAGAYTASLLGVGDSGFVSVNRVLSVDFERLARGAYKESDLRSDFLMPTAGRYRNEIVSGPNIGSVDIVADPANSGRGNVMRVRHNAGVGGGSTRREGGMRWRGNLPPADEYYFAYDIYVANNWHEPHQFKMPGLINGTMFEASHGRESPHQSTLPAFTAIMQINRDDAFGRGNAAMGGYYYDKDRVQRFDWLNTVDPTAPTRVVSGQYLMPQGRWIKIEQYVKVNTVNLKDGILRIWVDGVLLSDKKHRWRADLRHPGNRVSNVNRRIDGIWLYSYYGGNPSDPRNREHGDQHQYYDNFIVSNSPITH
ncbi:MAG: hypothetical protein COC05_05135 [Gammaproteobacteria bacterium]|nr:MAG: hypothetical protein COC05_05135 [Gammaproteobacteria bacterium]